MSDKKADRKSRKPRGIVKGTGRAFVVAVLVHVGLFLLAGMLVVFTVVKQREVEFEPPQATERPKMKLKKPKVRVKKTSRPKSAARITTTRASQSAMPSIDLPSMGGLGDGLGDVMEGFEIMPDMDEISVIGGMKSIGNDLTARFYDLKRDGQGRPIPSSHDTYLGALRRFIIDGWKPSALSRYYKAPQKLYATCVLLPGMPSYMGPRCFDETTKGYHWAVHYTGDLVYPEDITFRFWGYGDNILVAAVDGETVLNACRGDNKYIAEWNSKTAEEGSFLLSGSDRLAVGGQWITLKAGEARELDIVIGEVYGGGFSAYLVVEVKGVDYPSRPGSADPMLPMFKTEEPSHDLLDTITEFMPVHEASLTNGPVFKDYISAPVEHKVVESVSSEVEVAADDSEAEEDMRVWTTRAETEFEGKFIIGMGEKLVFETKRGKQVKVPKDDLSDEDLEYIALNNPPEFDIDFIKTSQGVLNRYPLAPQTIAWGGAPPKVSDYTFGARVKQVRKAIGNYEHELTVEYFVVGKQTIEKGAYMLVDRQSSSFIPSRENSMSHEFRGDPIEFIHVAGLSREYTGYLVTIRDSRGKIIQHKATKPWLWENLDNLEKMPVGRYMDKSCMRTFPAPRKRSY